MPSIMQSLSLTLFFALLFSSNPTFSADVPESSPSPSPQLPPQAISPPPTSPAPSPAFPDSLPAPPPGSPSPAPSEHRKSPSPAPNAVADVGVADQSHLDDSDQRDDSGGMSGGKKAGIVIGVIAAGCVVWLAAMVYKKRQHNIRRRQYSYTDRRDFL